MHFLSLFRDWVTYNNNIKINPNKNNKNDHIVDKGNLCSLEYNISNEISPKISLSNINSPQKIVREDSHCGLLENSCDDLSDDDVDDCDRFMSNDDTKDIEYFDGTSSLMICHKRKNIFPHDSKRVAEIKEESGTYINYRVSSSLYSEDNDVKSNTIDDDDEGCRGSTDMSDKLVGCLPCAPSPSKAAFAVGGAAKKCAGSLISCKKSNISSAVSPKKPSMLSALDSPQDNSFYALSAESELCCGAPNMKHKNKKL